MSLLSGKLLDLFHQMKDLEEGSHQDHLCWHWPDMHSLYNMFLPFIGHQAWDSSGQHLGPRHPMTKTHESQSPCASPLATLPVTTGSSSTSLWRLLDLQPPGGRSPVAGPCPFFTTIKETLCALFVVPVQSPPL